MVTMTETWMGASQQNRPLDDLYAGVDDTSSTEDPHQQMRSSLGLLIERSTSAPPADSREDSLLNDEDSRLMRSVSSCRKGLDVLNDSMRRSTDVVLLDMDRR